MTEEQIAAVAAGLEAIRVAERDVQLAAGAEYALEPTRGAVAQFALAQVAEVVEFANELQWKHWKQASDPDPGQAAVELPDQLAFLGLFLNWLYFYGITTDRVAEAFAAKCDMNVRRMRGEIKGYGLVADFS